MISATSILTAFIKTMASVTPLHFRLFDNTVLKNVLLFCVFVAHRLNLWRFENENAGSENDWKASGDKFSFHLFSQKKFFAAKATHRCIQQTFFRSRNSGFRVFSALHQLFQSSNLFQIISFSFSSGRSDKKKRGAKKMAASSWNEDFVFCHVFHEPAASKKQSSGKTTTKTKPLMNRCCRCRVSFVPFRFVSYRIGSLRANH